mgnify:CR=1 FL=1
MTEAPVQASSNEVRGILIKCGVSVLALIVLVAGSIRGASEIGDAMLASLHWIVETISWVVSKGYAAYAYWTWMPLTLTVFLYSAFLWLTCAYCEMAKRGITGPVYERIKKLGKRVRFLACLSTFFYAPLSPNPGAFAAMGFVFGIVIFALWFEASLEAGRRTTDE